MTSHTTRTTRTVRAAAVATAAAGLLLAPVGAANAKTLRHQDARAEVTRITYDDTSDSAAPAPHKFDGDITSARFAHYSGVSAVIHFKELKRVGDERSAYLKITTNEGLHRDVFLSARSGHWAGTTEMDKPNGDRVKCKGMTHKIDYKTNIMTIRVPRSCLSNPRWVKLGFAFAVDTRSDGNETVTVDDALRNRPWGIDDYAPKMSSLIHRTK